MARRSGGDEPVPWLSKGIARAPARTPALLPSPLAPEGGVPARRLQSCLPASQTPPVGPQADATEPAEPSRRAIPSRRPSRLDGCRKSSMPTRATRGHSSTRRWECPCRRPRTRRFPTAPLWGRRSAPWRRSTETHYLCLCAPTTQRFRSRILRQQLQPSHSNSEYLSFSYFRFNGSILDQRGRVESKHSLETAAVLFLLRFWPAAFVTWFGCRSSVLNALFCSDREKCSLHIKPEPRQMHARCPAQLQTLVHEVYQGTIVHPVVIVHEPDLEHP